MRTESRNGKLRTESGELRTKGFFDILRKSFNKKNFKIIKKSITIHCSLFTVHYYCPPTFLSIDIISLYSLNLISASLNAVLPLLSFRLTPALFSSRAFTMSTKPW